MHRRLAARQPLRVDSSSAMLAETRAFASGGVRFEETDLRAFATRLENAGAFDLVLSNRAVANVILSEAKDPPPGRVRPAR